MVSPSEFPPRSRPEPDKDPTVKEMLARFGADDQALAVVEETGENQPPVKVERIDNPESNENGVYLVSFPCDLKTLDYVIDVFAELVGERKRAGFNIFYSINCPYGPGNGLELVMAYRRSVGRVPDMPSVTGVDDSQLEGWFFNTVLRTIKILKTMRMTDITLHHSREDALTWVQSKQKKSEDVTVKKETYE